MWHMVNYMLAEVCWKALEKYGFPDVGVPFFLLLGTQMEWLKLQKHLDRCGKGHANHRISALLSLNHWIDAISNHLHPGFLLHQKWNTNKTILYFFIYKLPFGLIFCYSRPNVTPAWWNRLGQVSFLFFLFLFYFRLSKIHLPYKLKLITGLHRTVLKIKWDNPC